MKKRKRGKLSKNPYSKKELIDVVLSFFRESPHKNFNYKQIYKLLGSNNPEIKTLIVGVLLGLYKNGSILEIKPGKYKLSEHSHKKTGIIKTVSFRGLLIETEDKEEVFVSLDYSRFAFIGDRVSVLVFPQKKGRKKGEVLKVLERKKSSFVGVLQKDSKFAFLIPDNKKVPFDIFIPKQELDSGSDESKLLVVGWGSTYGAIKTVVRELAREGVDVAHAHIKYIQPMPNNLGEILANFDKILIPEMNNGQLIKLIRDQYLVDAKPLNKIKGVPFEAREIKAGILNMLKQ